MPRLVMLDDNRLEAYIDGNLLIFSHTDMPGVIGHVGTVFGKHQVNIAQMSVGRRGNQQGGDAIGVLNLDSEPSAESLQELLSVKGISRVQSIQLPPAGQLPSWLQG
jgi:D-3-phosphoglycerate dehydrogenase